MTDTKHTPGPWTAENDHIYGNVDPENSTTYQAPIARIDDDWQIEIKHANARLIAAAPELLDVVVALLTARETMDGRLIVDENSPLIDAARAAIAKATGK